MTESTRPANEYSGFLPPRFQNRPDADDVVVKTWTVGDALEDHNVPEIPAALSLFFDLVAPAAGRADATGFAMLWLDRHPHEAPGWRLSIGHVGSEDDLEMAVAKPLARLVDAMPMANFECESWHPTRPLWRKRAEPVKLVFWGDFAKHARAILDHSDGASFYQPLGAGLRSDDVATMLPLLEDMLGDPFLKGGMGFEDALRLGVALGRAHLIESWIEAGGAEKRVD